MKRLLYCVLFFPLVIACNPPQKTTESVNANSGAKPEEVAKPTGPLAPLSFFLGRWSQTEGPDLVSYEQWARVSDSVWQGSSWTLYHTDTVFSEKLELKAEGKDIYYIPTVKENEGPVRFKMTKLEDRIVTFENPEHDFPQKITYEARGDTMLYAKISAMVNGKESAKAFPLKRIGK
jgi:hypothetical protein